MSDEKPRRRHSPWYVWVVAGCLGSLAVATVCCALIFGVFGGLLLRLGAVQEAQTTTTRLVDVTGVQHVDIENFAGSVHVEPGVSGQVTVQAMKHARDNTLDAAQRDLYSISVNVQSSGDMITIRSAVQGDANLGPARSVDLLVMVPAQTDVQVRQGAGDVTVRGITGTLSALLDAGNLDLTSLTVTDQSSAQVRAGSVTFGGSLDPGATLSILVTTGSVSVSLPPATATHVDAMTSSGRVSVSGWQLSSRRTLTLSQIAGDTAVHPTSTLVVRVGTGNVAITAGQ
ncbi:MAG TPA: hypothetical protein VGS80_25070 [Ktedonobacterales bacterium]|nr:hypothetical protein [Ktedonobacterales bacterium]